MKVRCEEREMVHEKKDRSQENPADDIIQQANEDYEPQQPTWAKWLPLGAGVGAGAVLLAGSMYTETVQFTLNYLILMLYEEMLFFIGFPQVYTGLGVHSRSNKMPRRMEQNQPAAVNRLNMLSKMSKRDGELGKSPKERLVATLTLGDLHSKHSYMELPCVWE